MNVRTEYYYVKMKDGRYHIYKRIIAEPSIDYKRTEISFDNEEGVKLAVEDLNKSVREMKIDEEEE